MKFRNFGFIPLNAHPFLFIAIAYFFGIILQICVSPLTSILLYVGCAAGVSLYGYKTQQLPKFLIFLLTASILGSVLYQRQINNHNYFYEQTANKTYDVMGTITSLERVQHPCARKCLTLSISKIKKTSDTDWQDIDGTIQIYVARAGALDVADEVCVYNLSSKKPKNESFDRYLMKEGINATLFAPDLEFQLIKRPTISFDRFLHNQRVRVIAEFKKKLPRNTFTLATSIFLGYKSTIKKCLNSLKEPFKIWGVSHYLARSGLHLVIFVGIWAFILNKLPLIFWIKEFFVLLLCISYFLLSWSSISFIRALALFFGYKACTFTQVRPNFMHLLTLVSCAVVLHNPMQLFFLDFQLSFGLTFALAWIGNTQTQATASTKA